MSRPGRPSTGDGMKSRLMRRRGSMRDSLLSIAFRIGTVPATFYRARFDFFHAAHSRCEARYRQLGNARLATGLAAVVLAALALGGGWISPWWLMAPLVVFVALAIVHDRVDRARAHVRRGETYYQRALARLEGRWIGTGAQGERFRDPKHIYADDLDVFGRGS